jgi:hypothetical protein
VLPLILVHQDEGNLQVGGEGGGRCSANVRMKRNNFLFNNCSRCILKQYEFRNVTKDRTKQ